MAEPFIGEIRMVGFTFAPRDWANCDGEVMQISQNPSLYSLLGTQFGGNGSSTFALPDMRGRAPVHPGNDVTVQGSNGGSETVTLDSSTMAAHTHSFNCNTETGDTFLPTDHIYANAAWAGSQSQALIYDTPSAPTNLISLNPNTCSLTGGMAQAHENQQPSQVVRFAIALQGLYPPRT